MADIVEVRGLLAEQPSVRRWRELCQMLDSFPIDERNDIVIPYCRQHLEMTPAWAKLRRPTPNNWVEAFLEGFEVFPQLALVSQLNLSGHREKRDEIVDCVADLSAFVMLDILQLNDLDLDDAHVTRLAQAPHLRQVRKLTLTHNDLSHQAVIALATSPYLGNLEYLDLSHNQLGEEGAVFLAEKLHFPKLQFLDLSYSHIEANPELGRGAKAIADSAHLPATIKANWHR